MQLRNPKLLAPNSGIYKIDLGTDKVYIGSSKNIDKRLNSHLSKLRRGSHSNQKLQRAFDKHGEDCFNYKIIEEEVNENKLLKLEQYYLDNHIDFTKDYNICKVAGSGPNTSCRVLKINNKGQIEVVYESIVEAAEKEEIDRSEITRSNITNTKYKGFYWRYEINKECKGHKCFKYDLKGNYLEEYDSIRSAARSNNTTHRTIIHAIENQGTAANFQWRKVKSDCIGSKSVKCKINISAKKDDEIIIFDSITDCAKFLKVNPATVSRQLKGSGNCKGYKLSKQ